MDQEVVDLGDHWLIKWHIKFEQEVPTPKCPEGNENNVERSLGFDLCEQ